MADFFPPTSIAKRIERLPLARRFAASLPVMAVLTGVLLRLWRSYTLTHGSADSWAWIGGTFLVGAGFLCLMCALHLANFTLRHWFWRAPLFAIAESATEIAMSLALTTVNLEPLGAEMAAMSDWIPTATRILAWRLGGLLIFSLVLGVVVWVVRRLLLASEDRTRTISAVHRASAGTQRVND
ncbi:MAG: hypothetical protein FJ202_01965 [Gemmatimonadetes bacterium]|nr:hypothetical protein [Gemmatimonadota bacterium]